MVWPSPTNHGECPANRCGRDHPGDRRAGCPHPAGPCGGANPRGRDKSLPYKPRRAHGQPGNRNPRVMINLCRGRCLHRPGDPAPPQGPAGGPWPSPTNHGGRLANRCGRNHPGDRRAGYPHPAGPRGGGDVCGLIWPPCQRGRKRRSGDCVERSRRSREPQFKKEEFLRHVASLKRHLAVRQSLRHGLRPCHLPLAREAKRCGQPVRPRPPGRP